MALFLTVINWHGEESYHKLKGVILVSKRIKAMDGSEAAAYASYAFTEVTAIYPITLSSQKAEHVDSWSANGRTNISGQTVKLVKIKSEFVAVSAMYGALRTALAWEL